MTCSLGLIFTPNAGQGDPNQKLSLIQRTLEPHCHLKIYQATKTIKPSELAQQAIAEQADIIVAAGGDGTIS